MVTGEFQGVLAAPRSAPLPAATGGFPRWKRCFARWWKRSGENPAGASLLCSTRLGPGVVHVHVQGLGWGPGSRCPASSVPEPSALHAPVGAPHGGQQMRRGVHPGFPDTRPARRGPRGSSPGFGSGLSWSRVLGARAARDAPSLGPGTARGVWVVFALKPGGLDCSEAL